MGLGTSFEVDCASVWRSVRGTGYEHEPELSTWALGTYVRRIVSKENGVSSEKKYTTSELCFGM